MKKLLALTLALLFFVCAVSCGNDTDPWEDALYTEDTALGEGKTTVTVKVEVEKNTVTFTLKTDKENLADAMNEHGLIEGTEGDYGLYIKKINGITADYDKDQRYWLLYVNGEYAMASADNTEITENAVYTFKYTK